MRQLLWLKPLCDGLLLWCVHRTIVYMCWVILYTYMICGVWIKAFRGVEGIAGLYIWELGREQHRMIESMHVGRCQSPRQKLNIEEAMKSIATLPQIYSCLP